MATLKSTTINGSLTLNGDFNIGSSENKTTFQVIRNTSISTSTTGYWAAMANSNSTGSPVLPTSSAWWHVISMDWIDNSPKNWVSQVAFPTKDASGKPPYYRHNTGSTDDISSATWHAFITDENISSQSVKYAGYSEYSRYLSGNGIKVINGYDTAYASGYNFTDVGNSSSTTYKPGMMIAQNTVSNETSGIFLGGDYINMWSPADNYSLRYYDEDNGNEIWNIDASANFSGAALRLQTISGNASSENNVKGNIIQSYSSSTYGAVFQWCSNPSRSPSDTNTDNWYFQLRGLTNGTLALRYRVNGGSWSSFTNLMQSSQFSYSNGVLNISN